MMRKLGFWSIALLVIASMLVATCGPTAEPAEPPAATEAAQPTEALGDCLWAFQRDSVTNRRVSFEGTNHRRHEDLEGLHLPDPHVLRQ